MYEWDSESRLAVRPAVLILCTRTRNLRMPGAISWGMLRGHRELALVTLAFNFRVDLRDSESDSGI